MTVEYGLRVRYDDGREADTGPCSLTYARLAVQSQSSDRARWNPQAVCVLQREVGPWVEALVPGDPPSGSLGDHRKDPK